MVYHPIAPTSDAGSAEREEELGPKTYTSADFSNTEDSVDAWRATALFGVLLVAEGIVFLATIRTGVVTGPGGGPFLALPVLTMWTMLGVTFFGGVVAAMAGFGTESFAFFGAAAVGIGVWAFVSSASLPGVGPTLGQALVVFGIVVAVGGVLLALGATGIAWIYVTLARAR
jgi:hypothetical protein